MKRKCDVLYMPTVALHYVCPPLSDPRSDDSILIRLIVESKRWHFRFVHEHGHLYLEQASPNKTHTVVS